MKRLLALLLVLVMCVGVFSGCNLFKKKTETPAAAATLEQAKDYLYNIMKDKNDKVTANDYDVIGKLIIDGTTFEITWKTDNASIVVKASNKENCWTIDIPDVNAAEVKYTLTATIKNEAGETIEVSFTPKLPVIEYQGIVTEPVAGVAYKLFFKQVNLGRTYYASNTTQNGENKFIEAKLDPKEAANFYVEVVDGGYKIYTEINGVKNYVHATAVPKDSGEGYTKCIGFATTTDCVYTYDSSLQTFYVVIGAEKFGVGTYGTYDTICLSELVKHFKTDNIEVKDGQFPVRFIEAAYAETLTPDVIPPHVHEYKDGYCDCGEKDPNATEVTTQAPILTATTLALGAYADGTKALVGVPFEYTQLGTYGNGIQWRTKDGKSSAIWNTAATPLGIEKIEITLAEGKTGYSNTDALVITFGDSAENLSYRTTLSTEAGVAKYTITPDVGTYTFFKMVHNFNNTLYVERIAIYYTGGEAHEHEFVEGECACGESDPNYVPSHICVDADANYVCDDATCAKVVAPAADSTLTIEQANALGVLMNGSYTTGKYYVVGTITEVYNTQYGNAYIQDANGTQFTVYGMYTADGATRYDAMDVKPVAGDVITVYGTIGSYNGAAQMKNGWVTDTVHEHEFVDGSCACGAADPNYVPTHDCVDVDGDFVCDETDCTKVVLPAADSILTIEQANALGVALGGSYTTDKYYVVGTITEVYNTTYGNAYIKDENGTLFTVYGMYTADGATRYDAMDVKPVAHDVVKVYGTIGSYNGAAQMKNGWVIEHTAHVCEYVDGACPTCGAVDPDAVPAHDEHTDTDGDFICDVNNCTEVVLPAADSTLTIEQANALGVLVGSSYTTDKYYVVGTITEVYNTQYGNAYIVDENGTQFTVYGMYSADGATRYDAMAIKPVAGDVITVYGTIGSYNGSAQMKSGWVTDTVHEHEFVEGDCACGAEDPDYIPAHDCVDTDGDFVCDETDCTEVVLPAADSVLTIAQANALGVLLGGSYTTDKYYVVGTITDVYNTTYGNAYIKDENGTLFTVYGLYSADGETRYDAMDVKPVAHDVIKVYGVIGSYNGAAQMKNGWVVEYTAHVCEYGADDKCICGTLNPDHVCVFTDGECVCGEIQVSAEAQYVKVTSAAEFTTGTYVLVVNNSNVTFSEISGTWVVGEKLTAADGVIDKDTGDAYKITLTVTDAGVTIKIGDKFVAPKSGNNNGIVFGTEYVWAYEMDADGNITFKGVGSDTTTLAYNRTNTNPGPGFRAYKNTTVTGSSASNYDTTFSAYKLVD